ncbi:SCO2525 family SAM-dependent methyltransferase [Phytohabitans flavus]|uniref:Methyltransferase n=1 Tax=Phytohabitans flavus TaxID=1076124 RepID=A0A6F8XXJ6_9ACTN|nr:SCO2525 family SAM-dependent methyltransferase [Phytohabitans flavus]BCB78517.1 hypothetical protein Pflav_049270 [Phytohabitans flavus]
MASRASHSSSANSVQPWDAFDTGWYLTHNYGTLRDDDQEIIHRTGDHFAATCGGAGRGIDVGTGANLYPALTMLPYCEELTLSDRASSNVDWLRREVMDYSALWDRYWAELAGKGRYSPVVDPRAALARVATVRQGDIFRLPAARWDIGTMFFVAESLSSERAEFELAVAKFVCCLVPGAPFAAAFMAHSHGYLVGDRTFPAVAIGVDDVARSLEGIAHNVHITKIATTAPLRQGYDGMILVLGHAGATAPGGEGRR